MFLHTFRIYLAGLTLSIPTLPLQSMWKRFTENQGRYIVSCLLNNVQLDQNRKRGSLLTTRSFLISSCSLTSTLPYYTASHPAMRCSSLKRKPLKKLQLEIPSTAWEEDVTSQFSTNNTFMSNELCPVQFYWKEYSKSMRVIFLLISTAQNSILRLLNHQQHGVKII